MQSRSRGGSVNIRTAYRKGVKVFSKVDFLFSMLYLLHEPCWAASVGAGDIQILYAARVVKVFIES